MTLPERSVPTIATAGGALCPVSSRVCIPHSQDYSKMRASYLGNTQKRSFQWIWTYVTMNRLPHWVPPSPLIRSWRGRTYFNARAKARAHFGNILWTGRACWTCSWSFWVGSTSYPGNDRYWARNAMCDVEMRNAPRRGVRAGTGDILKW
jgi:hypothetical protein